LKTSASDRLTADRRISAERSTSDYTKDVMRGRYRVNIDQDDRYGDADDILMWCSKDINGAVIMMNNDTDSGRFVASLYNPC